MMARSFSCEPRHRSNVRSLQKSHRYLEQRSRSLSVPSLHSPAGIFELQPRTIPTSQLLQCEVGNLDQPFLASLSDEPASKSSSQVFSAHQQAISTSCSNSQQDISSPSYMHRLSPNVSRHVSIKVEEPLEQQSAEHKGFDCLEGVETFNNQALRVQLVQEYQKCEDKLGEAQYYLAKKKEEMRSFEIKVESKQRALFRQREVIGERKAAWESALAAKRVAESDLRRSKECHSNALAKLAEAKKGYNNWLERDEKLLRTRRFLEQAIAQAAIIEEKSLATNNALVVREDLTLDQSKRGRKIKIEDDTDMSDNSETEGKFRKKQKIKMEFDELETDREPRDQCKMDLELSKGLLSRLHQYPDFIRHKEHIYPDYSSDGEEVENDTRKVSSRSYDRERTSSSDRSSVGEEITSAIRINPPQYISSKKNSTPGANSVRGRRKNQKLNNTISTNMKRRTMAILSDSDSDSDSGVDSNFDSDCDDTLIRTKGQEPPTSRRISRFDNTSTYPKVKPHSTMTWWSSSSDEEGEQSGSNGMGRAKHDLEYDLDELVSDS